MRKEIEKEMMLNRKMNYMLLLMLTCTLLLAGCGGGKKKVNVDVSALASELNEQTVTSDSLTQAAEAMVPTIYNIDASLLSSSSVYTNSGATSCEVGVFECTDEKAATTVKTALETHAASQEELYRSYNAPEADKLAKAIIKTQGKYAVIVVCDDTAKAEEILKKNGF